MSEQRLRIDREHDGKVAVVTLTRPEKHNALDRATTRFFLYMDFCKRLPMIEDHNSILNI